MEKTGVTDRQTDRQNSSNVDQIRKLAAGLVKKLLSLNLGPYYTTSKKSRSNVDGMPRLKLYQWNLLVQNQWQPNIVKIRFDTFSAVRSLLL